MNLKDVLMPRVGGMSTLKRLTTMGAIKVNDVVIGLDDLEKPALLGDNIQVGKHQVFTVKGDTILSTLLN